MTISERRPHFIGYLREEEPFYWWWSFSVLMPKIMLEVGCSVILWSMLYLESYQSRSSYFIGVA